MKSALQDEDNGEDVPRDAKGREVLSPEERLKREEKARKVAAEVLNVVFLIFSSSLNARAESHREEAAHRQTRTSP
jgi:hypothetical protein